MTIPGKAIPGSTKSFADNYDEIYHVPFSDTGLLVSQVGFGSYRVGLAHDAHRQALRYALMQGINLIDTSANYGDGDAEILIGECLAELIHEGRLAREQVVIVSKAGYVQGKNYDIAQQRKQEGRPFPNLVKYKDGLDHCIHPEFLDDQLSRSLARLQVVLAQIPFPYLTKIINSRHWKKCGNRQKRLLPITIFA